MESLICTIRTNVLKRNLYELNKPIFMVKANCYGHGLGIVSSVEKYVTAFGVATESEGCMLRKYTDKPILVTSPCIDNADTYSSYALTPLIGSLDMASKLAYYNRSTKLHIKVDCGMGRFGFNSSHALERFCINAKRQNLIIKGIGSHIPSLQSKDLCKKRFREYVKIAERSFGRLLRHIEASSTSMDREFDIQRIGLNAYKNAMCLESRIAYVKSVNIGDTVGYEHIYTARTKELIAVVYGGYADGIPRSAVGYEVIVNGGPCEIVAVCMDVFMIRLSGRGGVGDRVEIFSSFEDVERLSSQSGRITYEIFTGIGRRCRFVYKE